MYAVANHELILIIKNHFFKFRSKHHSKMKYDVGGSGD
jgi:hypothetical protein